jgi:hypothetical protein
MRQRIVCEIYKNDLYGRVSDQLIEVGRGERGCGVVV